MPQDLDVRRKRIRYRSWHRGTKELDLLLGEFTRRHIDELSPEQLDQLERLLDAQEHDIYAWLTGRSAVPADYDTDVMRLLLNFKYAE